MRHLLLAGALALAAVTAGCSDAGLNRLNVFLDKADHAIDNFNAATARIDRSIVTSSAALARHCDDAKNVGGSLVRLADKSEIAVAGLTAVTAGINSWCAAPPQNTGTAVAGILAALADGRDAYRQAKEGG